MFGGKQSWSFRNLSRQLKRMVMKDSFWKSNTRFYLTTFPLLTGAATYLFYQSYSTRDMKERPIIMLGKEPPRDSLSFKQGTIGQAFLASLRTGDIILFTRPDYPLRPAKYVVSELQKAVNQAESEHIGLVYRDPHHSYPYVIEINYRGEPQVVNFEDRILHSNCKDILARTLHVPRMGTFNTLSNEWVQSILDQVTFNAADDASKEAYKRGEAFTSDVTTASAACDSTDKPFPFWNLLASAGNLLLLGWKTRDAERVGAPIRRMLSPSELAKQAGSTQEENEDEEDAFFQDAPLLASDPTAFISTVVARNAELCNTLKQYRSTQKRLQHQLELLNQNTDGTPSTPSSKKHLDLAYDAELVSMLFRRKSFLESQIKKLYKSVYSDTQNRVSPPLGHMTRMKHAPFASTALVADYLQHVGILPAPPTATEVRQTLASFDPETVPTLSNGSLNLERLQKFASISAPLPNEYFPHNFRLGAHLNTLRGLFGDEQYVTRYHQKPAYENDYLYQNAFERDESEL